MPKPLVLISKPLALDQNDTDWLALHRNARVEVRSVNTRQQLARHAALAKAAGVITMVSDVVDAAFFARAPLLKVVANHAVGYNNIDVKAAQARGIVICNTPDVLTNATAELTIGLLFAAARRFKEGTELLRRGAFKGWHPRLLLGRELAGTKLGIVGYGRIGRAVASKARALGMTVIHTSGDSGVPLKELLQTSDYISIHCPLNSETRKLIGPREFALMKPGSILINTARGEIVDEVALLNALKRNLRGAALDVFWNEPALRPALLRNPKVFVLPHIGSATVEARSAMGRLAVHAVVEVLAGRAPTNRVG